MDHTWLMHLPGVKSHGRGTRHWNTNAMIEATAQAATMAFKKRHALKMVREGLIAVINMVIDNLARTKIRMVRIWLV